MSARGPISPMYRIAMGACSPIVRQWGRLEASGLEHLPGTGPALVVTNHDSYWDPISIGVAALGRRQIKALAKEELWKIQGLNRILDGMGQIPIGRGKQDTAAMERAIEELRGGACIGIFPEGTRSRGRELRARSGLGRLVDAVPDAVIVCCSTTGTTDVPRFPTRPRIRIRFFPPAEGGRREGEEGTALAARLLAEIRAEAPIVAAGRR